MLAVGDFVLILGNVLLLALAADQLHDAIFALIYLSFAVTGTSISFYSRRSE